MSTDDFNMHFVCTLEEARALVNGHRRFWVSNCGCRENRGYCARSRIDVCMMFSGECESSGSQMKEISFAEAVNILNEAKEKKLVARPFRNTAIRTQIDGICFCCDDCCGYFLDKSEKCDPGAYIEITRFEDCTHCGVCTEVCYFGARKMSKGEMFVVRENCYGCGLCAGICPEECIELLPRQLDIDGNLD